MSAATNKRNAAVSRAYRLARDGALGAARQAVREAVAAAPLTPKQLYRLRVYFGPETLDEMAGGHRRGVDRLREIPGGRREPHHDQSDLMMKTLSKKMGGKA